MVIKDLVTKLVSALVDKPEEVNIESTENDTTIKLKIYVNEDDVGKVVGKKGQNIQAIRTYAKAIGAKVFSKKVIMDIIER